MHPNTYKYRYLYIYRYIYIYKLKHISRLCRACRTRASKMYMYTPLRTYTHL